MVPTVKHVFKECIDSDIKGIEFPHGWGPVEERQGSHWRISPHRLSSYWCKTSRDWHEPDVTRDAEISNIGSAIRSSNTCLVHNFGKNVGYSNTVVLLLWINT